MAENLEITICGICLRLIDTIDSGRCPNANPGAGNPEACLRLGIEARDELLAQTKALNDRSRLALIKLRDELDLAIEQTAPEVDVG